MLRSRWVRRGQPEEQEEKKKKKGRKGASQKGRLGVGGGQA
jgi:hypothetical protein